MGAPQRAGGRGDRRAYGHEPRGAKGAEPRAQWARQPVFCSTGITRSWRRKRRLHGSAVQARKSRRSTTTGNRATHIIAETATPSGRTHGKRSDGGTYNAKKQACACLLFFFCRVGRIKKSPPAMRMRYPRRIDARALPPAGGAASVCCIRPCRLQYRYRTPLRGRRRRHWASPSG